MQGENVLKSSRIVMVAVAVLLSASACSGNDDPKGGTSPSTSPSASDTGGIISPPLPKDPKFKGKPEGIIADVVVDSCDTETGTVKASGKATNSAKQAKDIVVSISWAVTTTSDVVARGIATLKDVAPGDTVDWDVEADLKSTEAVACVPTALRGNLR